MPEVNTLTERLARLAQTEPKPADSHIVQADLDRARVALRRRRQRRAWAVAGTSVGLVALIAIAVGSSSIGHRARPDSIADLASNGVSAIPADPSRVATPSGTNIPNTPTAPNTPSAHTPSAPTIELVAYHGAQLPGYTVSHVPAGYVLQGVSASVLDIAEASDHSPLDNFLNKIVVMLNDHPAANDGTPVTVNGHPGFLRNNDGVRTLSYQDGSRNVSIQVWSNIRLTDDQLLRFATGVTVKPSAQEGHG